MAAKTPTPIDILTAEILQLQKSAKDISAQTAANTLIFLQFLAQDLDKNYPTIAECDPTSPFLTGDYIALEWKEPAVTAVFKPRGAISICHIIIGKGQNEHILRLDGVWGKRVSKTFQQIAVIGDGSNSDDDGEPEY